MSYCSNESYMSRGLQARLVELDKITSAASESTRRMTTQTTVEPNKHRKACLRSLRNSTDYPRNYDLIFTDFATASNAVAKLIEANESRAKDFATALYDAESEFSRSYRSAEGRQPIDHLLYDAKATTVDEWNASQDRLFNSYHGLSQTQRPSDGQIADGRPPSDFSAAESCASERPLGDIREAFLAWLGAKDTGDNCLFGVKAI